MLQRKASPLRRSRGISASQPAGLFTASSSQPAPTSPAEASRLSFLCAPVVLRAGGWAVRPAGHDAAAARPVQVGVGGVERGVGGRGRGVGDRGDDGGDLLQRDGIPRACHLRGCACARVAHMRALACVRVCTCAKRAKRCAD